MEKINSSGGDRARSRLRQEAVVGVGANRGERAPSQEVDLPVVLNVPNCGRSQRGWHSRSDVQQNAHYWTTFLPTTAVSLQDLRGVGHTTHSLRKREKDLTNKTNEIAHKVMRLCCSSQNLSGKEKGSGHGDDQEDRRPRPKPKERRSRWSSFFGNGSESYPDLSQKEKKDRFRRNSSPGLLRRLSRSPRRSERAKSMPSIADDNEKRDDIWGGFSGEAGVQRAPHVRGPAHWTRRSNSGIRHSASSLPRRVDFTFETKMHEPNKVLLRKVGRV